MLRFGGLQIGSSITTLHQSAIIGFNSGPLTLLSIMSLEIASWAVEGNVALHYTMCFLQLSIRETGLVFGACVVFSLLLVCARCICRQTQALHILSAELLWCEEECRHLWAIDMACRWLSVTDGSEVKRPRGPLKYLCSWPLRASTPQHCSNTHSHKRTHE